jgi:uncharacterized protein (TIGR03435 family)
MAALLLLYGIPAGAQPRLDVVSVRENPSTAPNLSVAFAFTPGRLQITNMSIEDLVAIAYDVRAVFLRDKLIVGLPTGLGQRRFDIQATLNTTETLSAKVAQQVVRAVLEQRFGFKAHMEQRPTEVYVLSVATEGKLGPQLRAVEFNCAEIEPAKAPKDKSGRSECRQGNEWREGIVTPFLHGSGPISRLVYHLENNSRHPVIDQTGLTGFFVWDLDYGLNLPGRNRLEAAVREQLGLKLELKLLPFPVVVIDEVRMPTPN